MKADSKKFELQDVTAGQAAQLAEFGARTFFESFAADNTPEDMRRHLESAWSPQKQLAEIQNPDIDTMVLADEKGRWLGLAQLRANKVSEGVPKQGSMELWRFYVDKPFHGQGVAGELMNRRQRTRAPPGRHVIVAGRVGAQRARQAFYAKHGFRKVGSQVFIVGSDPQTDHVMLCPLG